MKLTVVTLLCLPILLAHINFSFAKRRGGFLGKITLFKKTPKTNNVDTRSRGGILKQPKKTEQFNQGYPQQPGGYPYQRGYPQQPGYPAGGYQAGGYPYGGGYGAHGGYAGHGSYGGYGGGYINQNPNNRVLSPHYGGSFGYGGHGAGRGSPFSRSVKEMGMYPSDRSRGFGRSAVMAAAGGAMAGMALGYGLGRFPRPLFHFHNSQEEYYYNHYMHRKYGVRSTDTNDYSRDYAYSKPPETYDRYMDSCMKRDDLLPAENRKPDNKPAATTTATATVTNTTTTSVTATDTDFASNTSKSNITAPSTPRPLNKSEADPVGPASLRKAATNEDEDDDTVSIVEIGYPALIEQMKARRCLELYMVYSEKYLRRKTKPSITDGVQRLEIGLQGLLAVVPSLLMATC